MLCARPGLSAIKRAEPMMSISGNNRVVLNKIRNLQSSFQEGIRRGLQQSGLDIAGKAGLANDGVIKKDMNAPKHGRPYQVTRGRTGRVLARGRTHIASAPGEAPGVISGRLRRSVYFSVQGANRLRIGANTPYARFLEDGTDKMAPRPYLRNNIEKSRQTIRNNIVQAINSKMR
jgi:HK97 gp10 family phage protein